MDEKPWAARAARLALREIRRNSPTTKAHRHALRPVRSRGVGMPLDIKNKPVQTRALSDAMRDPRAPFHGVKIRR